ncbi:MAG: hypothetical protein ACR2OB_02155 [Solirubrobacteraceae bacterium]
MTGWLIATSAALGGAHLALLGVSVRRRSALSILCAFVGLVLLVVGIASAADVTADAAVVFAAVALVIGTVLLAIGQAIWRLLGDAPEKGS